MSGVLKEGATYFVAICPQCRKRHILGESPAPDFPEGYLVVALPVTVNCDCGKTTIFQPEEVIRWQVPQSQ